jgi:hypothetical protein
MEAEHSLPHLQVPVTCLYPEPAQSSPYPTSYFLKIHLNIIHPSTHESFKVYNIRFAILSGTNSQLASRCYIPEVIKTFFLLQSALIGFSLHLFPSSIMPGVKRSDLEACHTLTSSVTVKKIGITLYRHDLQTAILGPPLPSTYFQHYSGCAMGQAVCL